MKQIKRAFFVAVVLLGGSLGQVAQAQVEFIDPVVDIPLPTINFDANINPVPGTFSGDALNIIRAHRVALQQVQAAIQYLRVHRDDILAGENTWYNENFGDFYDPNSPFAGLYNRIIKHDTGKIDKFGNPVFEDWYNTAHYDRVLFVFQQIQIALKNSITYAWGAQRGVGNTADPTFDAFRTGALTVGDPLFGTAAIPDTVTPVPIDPLTGLPLIDPLTGQPYVNPSLVGDPLINNPALTLVGIDRGIMQWGHSTSFTTKHLTQRSTDPSNPLRWDEDNDISTPTAPLSADEELAFFKDRLDAYADTATDTVFVGGAFLNESQRSNSSVDGEPNPFFHPTEFKQYQQIISALAQSEGSVGGTAIENGIAELMGSSAYFFESLDGRSYASFVDLFQPVEEGGIGDGTLLPPPGKQGGRRALFIPLVPAS